MDGAEEGIESGFVLERAEPWRVWGRHVEHEVVTQVLEPFEGCGVVRIGFLEWGDLAFAEVDSDGNRWPMTGGLKRFEAAGDLFGTLIVESEAIDEAADFWNAKDSWFRISGLGFCRDGADLCEPEPEGFPAGEGERVFIEASGESNRRGKAESKCVARQLGRQWRANAVQNRAEKFQRSHGHVMNGFRVDAEEHGAQEGAVEIHFRQRGFLAERGARPFGTSTPCGPWARFRKV